MKTLPRKRSFNLILAGCPHSVLAIAVVNALQKAQIAESIIIVDSPKDLHKDFIEKFVIPERITLNNYEIETNILIKADKFENRKFSNKIGGRKQKGGIYGRPR